MKAREIYISNLDNLEYRHNRQPGYSIKYIRADLVPDITLEGADTDNPRLCLGGQVVALVQQDDDDNSRWFLKTIHGYIELHVKDKQTATRKMCEKFGVGGLVKGGK